ncbi:bifunctional serine/threonine protein kinase/MFS transporter [Laspinema olomoucense]|uniref:non-specific serine/threonine protein kinase n=1 Tax=Laspinema olomoucense D3b TaxID=2953688 RepID=A0ABT2NEN1_9CYAN|nr:bifunctional serine/threonine protein kinase/MFS transporter [Laspinema sp. D3b]MCT7981161.1 bifunctional serine/threonine protein kinase/MFS transporter [Laspinema sp. D3b]
MMSNLPDFGEYGYQVIRELGQNRAGGRVTYLATRTGTETATPDVTPDPANFVAIKQFQFASTSDAGWAGYEAYQREIQVLQGLNHPGIPRYLDSFESPRGFCMVQEYKAAESLAQQHTWHPIQVKEIAVALLSILVYLQNRLPAVIHRDIKPENILVDQLMNVYLVDFGFAHLGGGEVAVSSIVKGTLGFMPPEQLFNRELTPASDLYGVGATLICLLTGTKSQDIGELIDPSYRIHFRKRVPKISLGWIQWLEKMVEPKPKDRYPNAETALEVLTPIEISRTPQVISSHQLVQFRGTKLGEPITQTISIKNPVPGTMLTGRWRVAAYRRDGYFAKNNHPWIAIAPARFKGNQVECTITVDTRNLIADRIYDRELLLQANSDRKLYRVALKIKTAPEPVEEIKLPYPLLGILLSLALNLVWTSPLNVVGNWLGSFSDSVWGVVVFLFLFPWTVLSTIRTIAQNPGPAATGAIAGSISSAVIAALSAIAFGIGSLPWTQAAQEAALGSSLLGALIGAYAGIGTEELISRLRAMGTAREVSKSLAGAIAGGICGAWPIMDASRSLSNSWAWLAWMGLSILTGIVAGAVFDEVKQGKISPVNSKDKLKISNVSPYFAGGIALLTVGLGISLGLALNAGIFSHYWVSLLIGGTAIPLGKMLYPHWMRSRQVREYHESKAKRIQP